MAQQARKQVQRLRRRRRQPVNPVPHFQQHHEGGVLGTLCVGVVQLQDEILDALGVKVQAVAKHLECVYLHVAHVGCLVVQVQGFVEEGLVDRGIIRDDAAPQVNVNRFKEGLPLVAEEQGPVVTLRRDDSVQSSSLPVREVGMVDRHEPALRVTPAERIHINGRHRFQCGVLSQADLEGNAHQHVDEIGLVFVALQCQQHSLSPARIEPTSQTHVIADVDGMDLYSTVQTLEKVLHLGGGGKYRETCWLKTTSTHSVSTFHIEMHTIFDTADHLTQLSDGFKNI